MAISILVTNPCNTICKWVYTNSFLFVLSCKIEFAAETILNEKSEIVTVHIIMKKNVNITWHYTIAYGWIQDLPKWADYGERALRAQFIAGYGGGAPSGSSWEVEPPDPQPGASPKAESFLSIFIQNTGQKLRKCPRRTVLSMTTVLRGHFHFHFDFIVKTILPCKTAQQTHETRHLHSSQNV